MLLSKRRQYAQDYVPVSTYDTLINLLEASRNNLAEAIRIGSIDSYCGDYEDYALLSEGERHGLTEQLMYIDKVIRRRY